MEAYVSHGGADIPSCATQVKPCKSLQYALTLLSKDTASDENTILLDGVGTLPYSACLSRSNISLFTNNVIIESKDPSIPAILTCENHGHFYMYSPPEGERIAVLFRGLVIHYMGFLVLNMELYFDDCTLREVDLNSITDAHPAVTPARRCIWMTLVMNKTTFIGKTFFYTKKDLAVSHGVINLQCADVRITLTDSTFDSTFLQVFTEENLIVIFNTVTVTSNTGYVNVMHFIIGVAKTNITIQDSLFHNMHHSAKEPNSYGAFHVDVSSLNNYTNSSNLEIAIDITNTSYINNTRAALLNLIGNPVITFTDCMFVNNHAYGHGGALSIVNNIRANLSYQHSKSSLYKVTFVRCHFIGNIVRQNVLSFAPAPGFNSGGSGGALYLDIFNDYNHKTHFQQCQFINNSAEAYGGSIFAGRDVFTTYTSNIFSFGGHMYPYAKSGAFIFAVGGPGLFYQDNQFKPGYVKSSVSLVEFSHVGNILGMAIYGVRFECPQGYQVSYTYDPVPSGTGGYQHLSQASYECVACYRNEYTLESSYVEVAPISLLENVPYATYINTSTVECHTCPYGGNCTDGTVVAQPNFWGHVQDSEVKFYDCPEGYCCGKNTIPCMNFDTCAPNHTGQLCGQCNSGYSLSILTANCVLESECERFYWFVIIGILWAFGNVLWHMFKRDIRVILTAPFRVISTYACIHPCQKRQQTARQDYVQQRRLAAAYQMPPIYDGSDPVLPVTHATHISHSPTNPGQVYNPMYQAMTPSPMLQQIAPTIHRPESHLTEDIEPVIETPASGYYDILTYYAQVIETIRFHVEYTLPNTNGVLNNIGDFILTSLNFEFQFTFVEFFSVNACSIAGLQPPSKTIMKPAFIIVMYLAWFILFLTYILCVSCCNCKCKRPSWLIPMKDKLIIALVELFKYSYVTFVGAGITYLTCTKISEKWVWHYEGNYDCLSEWWQYVALAGAILYIIPFSFTIITGTFLLRETHISGETFLVACLFPFPFLLVWFFLYHCKWKHKDTAEDSQTDIPLSFLSNGMETSSQQDDVLPEDLTQENNNNDTTNQSSPSVSIDTKPLSTGQVILDHLQGPYKMYNRSYYWEGVLQLHKLFFQIITMATNDIIRCSVGILGCVFAIVIQIAVQPFGRVRSNLVQSVSLIGLCLVGLIGLFRYAFTGSLNTSSTYIDTLFHVLGWIEDTYIFFILFCIVVAEAINYWMKCNQQTKQE